MERDRDEIAFTWTLLFLKGNIALPLHKDLLCTQWVRPVVGNILLNYPRFVKAEAILCIQKEEQIVTLDSTVGPC